MVESIQSSDRIVSSADPERPIARAAKLASEALITAYAYTYGFKAVILRLANIVGPRSRHGVIHEFIQKLNKNPKKTRNTRRRNTNQILHTRKRLHRYHDAWNREID